MRETQTEYVLRLKKESILDKRIPLGCTPPPKPEVDQDGPIGLDYETYYTEKFAKTGSLGMYEALNPMVRDASSL